MKFPITLSTGRTVFHRPYHNGATEAYLLNDDTMTEAEWQEYCAISMPKPTKPIRPTWEQIKSQGLNHG